MPEIEMRPGWWRYAIQAAGMARRSIKQMHPFEREVHDLEPEDCSETIRRIREADVVESDEKWPTVELTDTDVLVLWQGTVDIAFNARDKTPEHWNPETRWASVDLPSEHHYVVESLPSCTE